MELFTLRAKDAFLMNLKLVMDKRGLSQTDLSKLMDVSRQQVTNIFNGEGNLSLNTTEKIAKALKIEETDLFDPNLSKSLNKLK